MENMQEMAAQALVLITAYGALAAALTQGVKAIVKKMNGAMPEGLSAVIAGAISCGLTAVSLWDGGAQWQTAIIATIIAYYAPQIIYNGAAAGHLVAQHGGT